MTGAKRIRQGLAYIILVFLAFVFLAPIFIIVMNSFKGNFYISDAPFTLPRGETFAGFDNFVKGFTQSDFIYLGFGAGLSVFMFCGFIKSIPNEIEEAATIDGCSPLQTFFLIVFPILKPTAITVAILNAMWVWNDYLLPYLVLGSGSSKTLPVAVQMALTGGYGNKDMGALMAMLVLSILPIIIFYLFCQKYIIKGVVAGAVKG